MKTTSTLQTSRTSPLVSRIRPCLAALLASLFMVMAGGSAGAQDVGDGNLPPGSEGIVLRAYTGRKATQIYNLTPGFETRNGSWITLSAQFYYRDKTGRMQPLNYRSVPVTFVIGRSGLVSTMTGANGWATIRYRVSTSSYIPLSGLNVSWLVKYAGDAELNNTYSRGQFKLKR